MKMKKCLLALFALSYSLSALAEWVPYHRNADNEAYYDNQFLSRDGSLIRLWTLTDYQKPITNLEGQELLSEKSLTTIDCQSRKVGSEKVMKYAGQRAEGRLVSTMDTKLRLTSVRKGGSDDILLDKVCHS